MTDIIARALATKALQGAETNQYSDRDAFPSRGSSGKLYIDESNNQLYYWNETKLSYIPLVQSNEGIIDEVKSIVPQIVEESLDNTTRDNTEIAKFVFEMVQK